MEEKNKQWSTEPDRACHAAETAEHAREHRLSMSSTKGRARCAARAAAGVVMHSHTQIIALES